MPLQSSHFYAEVNSVTNEIAVRAIGSEEDLAALMLFGFGWAWLALDEEERLQVLALPNRDNPLRHNLRPIVAIDVWEHAYYLDYQNRRADYLKNLWLLLNWRVISARLG